MVTDIYWSLRSAHGDFRAKFLDHLGESNLGQMFKSQTSPNQVLWYKNGINMNIYIIIYICTYIHIYCFKIIYLIVYVYCANRSVPYQRYITMHLAWSGSTNSQYIKLGWLITFLGSRRRNLWGVAIMMDQDIKRAQKPLSYSGWRPSVNNWFLIAMKSLVMWYNIPQSTIFMTPVFFLQKGW